MKDEIQRIVDKFNNIYASKGITSIPPIKLTFNEDNYKKTLDQNNHKKFDISGDNFIFSVEFFLMHKIIEWQLHYRYFIDEEYNYTNDLVSYVVIQGIDLEDDEYGRKNFKSLYEGSEFIKNQIIKTYEKFQNL